MLHPMEEMEDSKPSTISIVSNSLIAGSEWTAFDAIISAVYEHDITFHGETSGIGRHKVVSRDSGRLALCCSEASARGKSACLKVCTFWVTAKATPAAAKVRLNECCLEHSCGNSAGGRTRTVKLNLMNGSSILSNLQVGKGSLKKVRVITHFNYTHQLYISIYNFQIHIVNFRVR
jgi:hypothetical protein